MAKAWLVKIYDILWCFLSNSISAISNSVLINIGNLKIFGIFIILYKLVNLLINISILIGVLEINNGSNSKLIFVNFLIVLFLFFSFNIIWLNIFWKDLDCFLFMNFVTFFSST